MIRQSYKDIVTPELLRGAIENNEYPGFLEDYHVLHCLLKIYQPETFLEVGTNMGTGTKIIKNALGHKGDVYSLDLPTELAHISLQHPISEGKGDLVGSKCNLPFTQLRGDSMTFDFSPFACDGFFIDGEHDFEHPFRESTEILKLSPKIVIWHDSDIPEVWRAIEMSVKFAGNYILHRIVDTRITYALRIDIANA